MTENQRDDIYYVCCLIEYISRVTKNHRGTVVKCLEKEGIACLLCSAQVDHCLSFEQVGEETVSQYQIPTGDFDTVSECKYTVPGYLEIGRVYQQLALDACEGKKPEEAIFLVFTSFISDAISNFNTNVYYSNPDYLRCSFLEGKLLA